MAFDAGMLRCILREAEEKLSGGKIEKIGCSLQGT